MDLVFPERRGKQLAVILLPDFCRCPQLLKDRMRGNQLIGHPVCIGRIDTPGQRIMLHRTHRGLGQRRLAREIGFDPGSISRWETGKRHPMKWVVWRLWEFVEIEPTVSHLGT